MISLENGHDISVPGHILISGWVSLEVGEPEGEVASRRGHQAARGGELDEGDLFDVRGQLGDFCSLGAPEVDEAVLAAREDELGVGCEGAFYYGGLIQKISKFKQLVPLEGVQQDDTVVGCP